MKIKKCPRGTLSKPTVQRCDITGRSHALTAWDLKFQVCLGSGNTKEGSITVPLISCLTGLESAVWQLTMFVFICKTDYSKPVKLEVNGTMILPPLVLPARIYLYLQLLCLSLFLPFRGRWKIGQGKKPVHRRSQPPGPNVIKLFTTVSYEFL